MTHPTVIRTTGNKDAPAHGRVWLDSATARLFIEAATQQR
jgi:hypothetical protein